jgi:hypothetical protein
VKGAVSIHDRCKAVYERRSGWRTGAPRGARVGVTPLADESYDEGEHSKTVFAHFGRAYYMANVFETGLAFAILQLEFLTGIKDRVEREGLSNFDRAGFQAAFDIFLDRQHSQTMGNLLKRVEGLTTLPERLGQLVADAKAKRDFLAHHYFRDRAEQFASRRGRDRMIEELDGAMAIFDAADKALEAFLEPLRNSLGMAGARFEASVEEYLKSLRDED